MEHKLEDSILLTCDVVLLSEWFETFVETLDPSLTVKKSKQCKMDCLAAEGEENTFL